MKKLVAAVGSSVCLLSAPFAKADITFCNNYSSHIYAAIGIGPSSLQINCGCSGCGGARELIGWYSINPGTCKTVYSGCFSDNAILYYATADNGAYWAGADYSYDLSTSAFDFCFGDPNTCEGSGCPPHLNYGPVGFRTWDLGGDNCGLFNLAGTKGTLDFN